MVYVIEETTVVDNVEQPAVTGCTSDTPCALKQIKDMMKNAKKVTNQDPDYDALYEQYKQEESYRFLINVRQAAKFK
ncbi:MAG: hypothetical protein LBF37_01525 [Rickettsiales bacterium]|jgi:hypothetical protein|nr:hypothetical protein [Rickettsiales bacterium]